MWTCGLAAVHMVLGHGSVLHTHLNMCFASASYAYSSDDTFVVHIGAPLFEVEDLISLVSHEPLQGCCSLSWYCMLPAGGHDGAHS